MKRWHKILLGVFLMAIIVAPFIVFGEGLVPCGKTPNVPSGASTAPQADEVPCTLCHIYVLVQNIISFLMWRAAPLIAVLVMSWGGFKMLASGSNPGFRQDGIRMIKDAVIGLLIVFFAWIIINQFLLFLAGGTGSTTSILSNPWNKVDCLIPPPSTN